MFHWSPWGLVACTAGEILAGLLIGIAALCMPHWTGILLLPVSWLLTTGGVRMLYVVVEHSCTHHIFSPNKATNRIVAEVISVLFWTQAYTQFKLEHATHHSVTRLPEDPDAHFLNEWGFYPGMPQGAVIKQLIITALSPVFHAKSFAERIQSSFSGPAYKMVLSALYVTTLFSALSALGLWSYWLVLWAFPVVFLFQISMVINILTEHRWPSQDSNGKRDLEEVCFGRFCGESIPDTDGRAFAERLRLWSVWWSRVVFVYLPYRLFVLVGDEPQHDFHHRQPTSDWTNAKFARFAQVSKCHADKSGEYTDEWGSLLDHIYASTQARKPAKVSPVSHQFPGHVGVLDDLKDRARYSGPSILS
jgi:hypothetical protein